MGYLDRRLGFGVDIGVSVVVVAEGGVGVGIGSDVVLIVVIVVVLMLRNGGGGGLAGKRHGRVVGRVGSIWVCLWCDLLGLVVVGWRTVSELVAGYQFGLAQVG